MTQAIEVGSVWSHVGNGLTVDLSYECVITSVRGDGWVTRKLTVGGDVGGEMEVSSDVFLSIWNRGSLAPAKPSGTTVISGTALRVVAVIGAAIASLSLWGIALQLTGHMIVKWSER